MEQGNNTSTEEYYEFFLSYKSEDAAIVRMIAEQMRASGLNVWFAEYNVGLKNRHKFEEAIESAINCCRFGVCFTNDHYTESEWCRWELELLLKHLGAGRIVEIALPREPLPHKLFPALSASACFEVPVSGFVEDTVAPGQDRSRMLTCAVIDTILEHIHKSTGVPISGCNCGPIGGSNRRNYRSHGVSYSLDFSRWMVTHQGCLARLVGWGGGDSMGPKFSMACPGGNLWGHIIVGKQDFQRKKLRIGIKDDRKYYDEALRFARHFYESKWKQSCIGVHLLFLEGFSHPAFTTMASSGMAVVMENTVWSRLYSVGLKGRWRWSRELEYTFFFFFRGDLASFLRSAHVMDRLVLSFKQEAALPARPLISEVDQQTRRIIEFLTEQNPQYVKQIKWLFNPIIRLVDFFLCGLIGRLLLKLGLSTSRRESIGFLSKAITTSSSKKVMAKALYYRGNYLFEGVSNADRSIADLSLAIWCDPNDCWARKDRATIFKSCQGLYGKGDKDFALPMTHAGACADAEAAIAYFQQLTTGHPSPEAREQATMMMRECEEVLRKLKEDTRA